MSLFIIIQARMTSQRLPGKVMLPLGNKPVLQILIERLKPFHEQLIIATTNDGSQTPIVELCQQLNVHYFEGDTNNVLERYALAARHFGAKKGDTIIRITSDCPFNDPDIVQQLLELHQLHAHSYCYTDIHHSFPRGFDCEVFTYEALEEAYGNSDDPYEYEHVTPYIRKHGLHLCPLKREEDNSRYRLTLDTVEDYQMLEALYNQLSNPIHAPYADILEILKKHPNIPAINAHVEQKHS